MKDLTITTQMSGAYTQVETDRSTIENDILSLSLTSTLIHCTVPVADDHLVATHSRAGGNAIGRKNSYGPTRSCLLLLPITKA